MKYLSVCDGIGAAHVAWKPLGWQCVGASEIEKFPKAVVSHHHPEIPELGDMTKYHEWNIEHPDLVCGGTPCQSFSVAGLRKGMADPRGNLALVFRGVVDHFRPSWVVWENVPGVLSSNKGRDFGAFLGGLGQLGYGFAYRVLDAQYFGLAQRRKRVFVVGCLGDWRGAAAVLFERHSLQGYPAPRRGKGSRPSDITDECIADGSIGTLTTRSASAYGARDVEEGFFLPVLLRMREGKPGGGKGPLISTDQSLTLATANDQVLQTKVGVRRLTTLECERLQGFPEDYTRIPWRGKPAEFCPDGPRYKALGNSWAVPVVNWIGKRIAMVDEILSKQS